MSFDINKVQHAYSEQNSNGKLNFITCSLEKHHDLIGYNKLRIYRLKIVYIQQSVFYCNWVLLPGLA